MMCSGSVWSAIVGEIVDWMGNDARHALNGVHAGVLHAVDDMLHGHHRIYRQRKHGREHGKPCGADHLAQVFVWIDAKSGKVGGSGDTKRLCSEMARQAQE